MDGLFSFKDLGASSFCPERFTLATLGYAELKEKGIGNPPGSHDKVIQGLDTSEVHLTKKKCFRYTFAREKSSGHLHFFGFCSVGLCGHQRSALECQFELLGAMCIHVCHVVEGG